MAFERPITVKEAIENIHRKDYLLPAIQREFVWSTERIERLFDSLMRDYPIGSFLFWHVEKQKSKEFQFYEFVRDYHEHTSRHNPKANISGNEDITAILDGQQRLTSLYVGLKGTYAYKLPRWRWDNPAAFPKRSLYLNLLQKASNGDLVYDFQFLTDEEASYRDENTFWFRVGHILDIEKEFEVNKYLINNHLLALDEQRAEFANETLFKLHTVIHKNQVINYFLEKDESLDKVLNVFIRVNSGGVQLSYSDLLLSIATAQWKDRDAREEITEFVDNINDIGHGFNFDKDFVLKTCLVLSDFKDIAFKVDNFNRSNMLSIESKWDRISEAIRLTVTLISSFGYNRESLTSANAIIPIAYYLLKQDLPSNFYISANYASDREQIRLWLIITLLKRTFSGQPDNVLRPIRQVLADNQQPYFPLSNMANSLRRTSKSIVFARDDIDNLFFNQYGKTYTFSALALVYPTLDFRNIFQQDHIFPKSLFTRKQLTKRGFNSEKIEFYMSNYNYLANLQLLEGIPNREKSNTDFVEWLHKNYPDEQERAAYMKRNYIPDIDLSFDNFEEFITERKKLMIKAYENAL